MPVKPVEWRVQARRDVEDAATWYVGQGGITLGERFLSHVESTLAHLGEFPGTGSTRHDGIVPGLPAPLRFFPISRFERYLVYYLDRPRYVDVIRIWDASRGLEALLTEHEVDR